MLSSSIQLFSYLFSLILFFNHMAWFLLVWYFFCSKCLRSQVAVIFHFEIVNFVQFLSCWCWHLLLNKTCVATLHVPFIRHIVCNDFLKLCYLHNYLDCIKKVYNTWSKQSVSIYLSGSCLIGAECRSPKSTVPSDHASKAAEMEKSFITVIFKTEICYCYKTSTII